MTETPRGRDRLPTLLSLALLVPASLSAQNMDSVTITTTPVAGEVYLLQGSGGNIGVSAGKDGVLLIDDQYAPLTDRIKTAVRAINPAPIRYVINTHWHGEHTGGNEHLAQDGVVIFAQENARRRMSREQVIKAFNKTVPPAPEVALPVITFTDTMTFYFNGDTAQVIHVKAAHTDGDAIVVFRHANVIHTGDTWFNSFYPVIDVSSGGSLDGMIDAADRVLAIANDSTRIIPGHGPLSNRAELHRYREMLATVRLRLSRAIHQGMTAEQVVNANLLSDLDHVWGKGFLTPAQFAVMAYASIMPN